MQGRQQQIAAALKVCPPFAGPEAVQAEIDRRVAFIQACLRESGMKTLVLGISGGVDSTTAGLLAQRAVEGLRAAGEGDDYRFIAVRLPYQVQHVEDEAQLAVDCIGPDECHTVNIGAAVLGLARATEALDGLADSARDFVLGNTSPWRALAMVYCATMRIRALVLPRTKSRELSASDSSASVARESPSTAAPIFTVWHSSGLMVSTASCASSSSCWT